MQFLKFSTIDQQAEQLALALSHNLKQLIAQQGRATLALSGGLSPLKFFEKLSHAQLAWNKVTITLVDERLVPTDHSASNAKLVREHFLLSQAQEAFFIDLTSNATTSLDAVNNANLTIPPIDIAVLGMGEDGHIASLFPYDPELHATIDPQLTPELTPERYVITTPTTANYQRISLSLAAILEIPRLFLNLNGTAKLATLELAKQQCDFKYPISLILAKRQDLQVYWSA